MTAAGVIALDPDRMRVLEAHLGGLGVELRRWSGRVADEVASTGGIVSVAREVAVLDSLAVECGRLRDDVTWRRTVVEQLPDALPRTSWRSFHPATATAAVDALALRVGLALQADEISWPVLAGALDELSRIDGSEELAARFLAVLGPQRTAALHDAIPRTANLLITPHGETGSLRAEVDRLGGVLVETVRLGSRHDGPGALDQRWATTYLGLPAIDEQEPAAHGELTDAIGEALTEAGYGTRFVAWTATAIGVVGPEAVARVAATVAGGASTIGGVISVAQAPITLTDGDGLECDLPEAGLQAVSGVLAVAGAASGNVPLAVAGAAVAGLAALFGGCTSQEPRRNETQRRYNPDTGESRLPSGSDNPHVEGPGVPLPPSYG